MNTYPEGIVKLFTFIRPFYFNKNFVYSWHEYFHFGTSLLIAFFFGFWLAWLAGWLWDIADGFKKLYTEGRDKSWLVQNLLYADGFSWSDVFVFDLIGALAGALIGVYL